MKPIEYPLEQFFWHLHDERGNTQIEIRDKNKNHVFTMVLKGHEYFEEKRLMEELAPLVVKLLNQNNQIPIKNNDSKPELAKGGKR